MNIRQFQNLTQHRRIVVVELRKGLYNTLEKQLMPNFKQNMEGILLAYDNTQFDKMSDERFDDFEKDLIGYLLQNHYEINKQYHQYQLGQESVPWTCFQN